MQIKTIKQIEPEMARCIEVDAPDRLFAIGKKRQDFANILSHNSVVQRNIVLGCILRPDSWRFLGIDLKKVELSSWRAYSNVVLGIATTIEDALTVLRFAQQTMMKRYAEMEQMGINNFLDLPQKGQALMVMVDEAGELLSPSGVKTEEGKNEDALKGEAAMIIGSIARLGRAAGVHLVIATQRPDATILSGETKANLGVRINCGRTGSTASSMILDNGEGTRVNSNPKGRLYLRIFGSGDHGQGFFATQDWIDEYLASKGLNPDGSPLSEHRSQLANVTDISKFEDGTLDEQSGIDNSAIIEQIREQEARGVTDVTNDGEEDDYEGEEEWGFNQDEENKEESEDLNDLLDRISDDDEEETDDEEEIRPTNPPPVEDKLGRPELSIGGPSVDKFKRPEEDWDQSLEDLINENFSDN
jgi:DNA segregation ATPase FtsK/SpoIIIE-like protein